MVNPIWNLPWNLHFSLGLAPQLLGVGRLPPHPPGSAAERRRRRCPRRPENGWSRPAAGRVWGNFRGNLDLEDISSFFEIQHVEIKHHQGKFLHISNRVWWIRWSKSKYSSNGDLKELASNNLGFGGGLSCVIWLHCLLQFKPANRMDLAVTRVSRCITFISPPTIQHFW